MEFKNDFNSYNYKYKKDEKFKNGYKIGSGNLENLVTRVPEDDNDSDEQFSLKNYLSQIKSIRISSDLDLNHRKSDDDVKSNPPEIDKSKPLNKQERLKKLENSLSGIQTSVEMKRSAILEDIYQKINNLENKITDSQLGHSKNIDFMSKRIENVEKTIDLVNKKHETVLMEKADTIDGICEKFHQSLCKEQESWRIGEKNIVYSINNQINSVKEEISDMKKLKSKIESNIKNYTDVELPKFKSKIESANLEIDSMEDSILKKVSDDLITLANFIKEEKEQMLNLKDKMMTHLNSELISLRLEIRQECEEREDTQKRLKSLMEETIKRLESPL